MNKYLAGGLAGFVATVPMTLAMLLMHRQLNWRERHPLPPEDITAEIGRRIGLAGRWDRDEHQLATWVSHFGFGTAAGGLYGPIAERVPAPPMLKGMIFGLLVWFSSYLGLLPATGILHQPKEQPPRPNLLMIVAHLVWGAALGVCADRWITEEEPV